MILDDFYFIGCNHAEMFGINFHSEWGKFGEKFFGNLNDNSFQIDVDLKDHDQEDLLPLPGGLMSADSGSWRNTCVCPGTTTGGLYTSLLTTTSSSMGSGYL